MSPLNDASAIPAPAGEVPPSASPVIAAASIHCRMSERYDVEGDAEVAASDGSAVFRGRVLNISATGCFVGTVAYIRFTPGTAVDLVFHIDGLDGPKQFQIHAEARVSRPRIGLGFRFLRMTAAHQQALDAILQALEETGTKAGPAR